MRLRAELPFPFTPISQSHFTASLPSYLPSPSLVHSRACLFRPTASARPRKLDLGRSVYSRLTSREAFGLVISAWVTMGSAQGCILGHVGQQFISLGLVLRGSAVLDSATSLLVWLSSLELLTRALKCDTHLKVVIRLSALCRHSILPPFAYRASRPVSSETPYLTALLLFHSKTSLFHESLFCAVGNFHAI